MMDNATSATQAAAILLPIVMLVLLLPLNDGFYSSTTFSTLSWTFKNTHSNSPYR
jgi:hypothetical protein